MTNVENFKNLISAAKESVADIFAKVEQSKGTMSYTSFYKSDQGYAIGIIQEGHYLPHGYYIDFGHCINIDDVIQAVFEAEKEMNLLIQQGLSEYVGR